MDRYEAVEQAYSLFLTLLSDGIEWQEAEFEASERYNLTPEETKELTFKYDAQEEAIV